MLSRREAVAHFDFRTGEVWPDRLWQNKHSHYLDHATKLIGIYASSVGRRRHEIQEDAERVFDDELHCPPRRIKAFIKILESAGIWTADSEGKCPEMRKRLFDAAAAHHPLVTTTEELEDELETDVKPQIAAKLGLPYPEVEGLMFDDVMENQRLLEFEGFETPKHLLQAYNLGQTQALLYDALSLVVITTGDFQHLIQHAKLCDLMHLIEKVDPTKGEDKPRLKFTFDGPASVGRETWKYGVLMADMLPAVLGCEEWSAVVKVTKNNRIFRYEFDFNSGLVSGRQKPKKFDTEVESNFFNKWGAEPRKGWTLIREVAPISIKQTVIIPDFLLRHDSGKEVYLEIVGYWTPQYLKAKRKKLDMLSDEINIILAVNQKLDWELSDGDRIVWYKSKLLIKPILNCLETIMCG